ncbi:hypothetical protein KAK07_21600 [Ideonella sp. 4Y16]|uniref:hypothetical protein n=1 Tax=Ideonella alba TaxID=2824118 RepID=UPI001B36F4F3|nr:hypothetical protein [Ideonella alba]MBQ0945951.1 hypothetical protein [Ideonella alba]
MQLRSACFQVIKATLPIALACSVTGELSSTTPQQLADRYVDRVYAQSTPVARERARRSYLIWFFEGFVSPGDFMPGDHDLERDAFQDGQAFWWTRPSLRPWVMQNYGYVEVRLAGLWTVGYEASSLEVGDGSRRRCWLWGLGDAQIDPSLAMSRSPWGVPVAVAGYLSPPGRYGHLGSYDCQVYATKIARDGNQPLAAPDPRPPGMPVWR